MPHSGTSALRPSQSGTKGAGILTAKVEFPTQEVQRCECFCLKSNPECWQGASESSQSQDLALGRGLALRLLRTHRGCCWAGTRFLLTTRSSHPKGWGGSSCPRLWLLTGGSLKSVRRGLESFHKSVLLTSELMLPRPSV